MSFSLPPGSDGGVSRPSHPPVGAQRPVPPTGYHAGNAPRTHTPPPPCPHTLARAAPSPATWTRHGAVGLCDGGRRQILHSFYTLSLTHKHTRIYIHTRKSQERYVKSKAKMLRHSVTFTGNYTFGWFGLVDNISPPVRIPLLSGSLYLHNESSPPIFQWNTSSAIIFSVSVHRPRSASHQSGVCVCAVCMFLFTCDSVCACVSLFWCASLLLCLSFVACLCVCL